MVGGVVLWYYLVVSTEGSVLVVLGVL